MIRISDDEMRDLCLRLLYADSEEDVISILQEYEWWDDPSVWRYYGDRENNFSTIGNQQAAPDAALVEKVVNSVDAVLMGECWARGMAPSAPEAPRSIEEAVACFFGEGGSGHIASWGAEKRRRVARRITVAATGSRNSPPCFTIADAGEGQTPESMPETLLSLDRKNKIDVHFVQGKFNMGGTGALQFCGRHNLQLVISRRRPGIPSLVSEDSSADMWGFTVVRREDPTPSRKMSAYTYLAPLGADEGPRKGGVLRFRAPSLPIFPEGNKAYRRPAEWGTAIKLYEYQAEGFKSHVLRRDGLLYRLDILLPGIALPVRVHECRDYPGHEGSYETTLAGLSTRLEENRAENLEEGFPTSSSLSISGQELTARIYAFKRGKADTYRKNEGVIFVINGQTHGHLSRTFFSRKAVGMNRLEDSILVVVDCTCMAGREREDLFMNSRDRLRRGPLRSEIERELESILKDHSGLRALRERRRREEVESRRRDNKPLREMLESILRRSPTLASLFAGVGPLSNPFKGREVQASDTPPKLRRHPTYFKFRGLDYGKTLRRETPINMRSRILFETDVENDYFNRQQYPGRSTLVVTAPAHIKNERPNYTLNLNNGVATLNVTLPKGCAVGEEVTFELTVTDDTLVAPFVNTFTVKVKPRQKPTGGKSFPRGPGRGSEDGHQREVPRGLAIPEPIPVSKEEWDTHGFDRFSALKVVHEGGDYVLSEYTYYVNIDNDYLKTELKVSNEDPDVIKDRWIYGLTLIGMALLKDDIERAKRSPDKVPGNEGADEETPIEDVVFRTTAAIAPVLLPLIESLGALSVKETDSTVSSA